MTPTQLHEELDSLKERYAAFKARDLKLNMARGKPSPEQLDLSMAMLDVLSDSRSTTDILRSAAGDDLRNYGGAAGTPEARELFAQILEVSASQVMVAQNSSLNLMYDTIARSMTMGVRGYRPWTRLDYVKFLCPSPGYDRHFAVSASFGIANISIAMGPHGPDMAAVEHYVNTDPYVKGIWCVPKYSNPTGVTYSDEVVRRFANLKPAAKDFRIFWDNAYAVHDLVPGEGDELLDLASACQEADNPDLWYMFASTSKITFAGSGISALATSEANLADIIQQLSYATIGPDKINQARHLAFLHDLAGVRAHMARHAELLRPRFEVVIDTLQRELEGLGIAVWTRPRGGYFISLDGLPGTARRTVDLAREAGVVLTNAGATYPYGVDYCDANIRIAPSYPSLDELRQASELLSVCTRIAAIEMLLKGPGLMDCSACLFD
jgi:DNA-binding transcriptional MocR family regulator